MSEQGRSQYRSTERWALGGKHPNRADVVRDRQRRIDDGVGHGVAAVVGLAQIFDDLAAVGQ